MNREKTPRLQVIKATAAKSHGVADSKKKAINSFVDNVINDWSEKTDFLSNILG